MRSRFIDCSKVAIQWFPTARFARDAEIAEWILFFNAVERTALKTRHCVWAEYVHSGVAV